MKVRASNTADADTTEGQNIADDVVWKAMEKFENEHLRWRVAVDEPYVFAVRDRIFLTDGLLSDYPHSTRMAERHRFSTTEAAARYIVWRALRAVLSPNSGGDGTA
jgi:hypothetical protein